MGQHNDSKARSASFTICTATVVRGTLHQLRMPSLPVRAHRAENRNQRALELHSLFKPAAMIALPDITCHGTCHEAEDPAHRPQIRCEPMSPVADPASASVPLRVAAFRSAPGGRDISFDRGIAVGQRGQRTFNSREEHAVKQRTKAVARRDVACGGCNLVQDVQIYR